MLHIKVIFIFLYSKKISGIYELAYISRLISDEVIYVEKKDYYFDDEYFYKSQKIYSLHRNSD